VGSRRQLRGRVLDVLRDGPATRRRLRERLGSVDPGRYDEVLDALSRDGLVTFVGGRYALAR